MDGGRTRHPGGEGHGGKARGAGAHARGLIASALVATAIAGLALVAWSRRTVDGPWVVVRAEVAALRFDRRVVRPSGVGRDPCGLARSDLLDAVEEGRKDALEVAVDPSVAGLERPTTLRIETRTGDAIEVEVGRSAPVGGRTYVRRDGAVWAVRGDLREALERVEADCGAGG